MNAKVISINISDKKGVLKKAVGEVMAMADMIVYEHAPPSYAPPDKPALRINNGVFVSEIMRMIRDQSISASH